MPHKDPEEYKKYKKNYYLANKEKIKEKAKKHREKPGQREKNAKNSKKWREDNKEKLIDKKLKYSYGINLDEYNDIFKKQGGICVICRRPQSAVERKFAVDHDHVTGKVRGLLCSRCNLGLGKFMDDINLLYSAIDYLKSN